MSVDALVEVQVSNYYYVALKTDRNGFAVTRFVSEPETGAARRDIAESAARELAERNPGKTYFVVQLLAAHHTETKTIHSRLEL